MINKANETEDLTNFKWDDSETFFGIETEKVEKDPLDEDEDEGGEEKTEAQEGTEKNKTEKPKTETKEEEEVPFKAAEEENVPNATEDEVIETFTILAAELAERGVFKSVKVKEGEKITEEKFFELQEEEFEGRVEEAIEDLITEIGEEGADYIKFIKSGGKNHEFFNAMAKSSAIPQGDITDDKFQDAFLKYYYKNVEGLDEEDVSDKIEWLSENNKKAKYAEKYHKLVSDADAKQKAKLIEDAKEREKSDLAKHKTFVKDINTTLQKTEKVGNFTLNKTDKSSLTSFITEPIKLPNGRYATELQIAVNKIMYQEDKTKLLLLAKLLKSDFDVTDVVTEVQSTVVRKTKSELSNQKFGNRPASSPNRRKSLADYFE